MSNHYDNQEHEVVPGVLRGYRQWQVYPDGLYACNFPVRWEPGVNTATHQGVRSYVLNGGMRRLHLVDVPDDQPAPVKGCCCGFYALHKPGFTQATMCVGGSIKAYGHVILGTIGFRAQYVEIESLWISDYLERKLPRVLPVIRDRYPDVPVFNTWADLTQAFPSIPVTELIGPSEPKLKRPDITAWSPPTVEEFIRSMGLYNNNQQEPQQ